MLSKLERIFRGTKRIEAEDFYLKLLGAGYLVTFETLGVGDERASDIHYKVTGVLPDVQ